MCGIANILIGSTKRTIVSDLTIEIVAPTIEAVVIHD